MYLNEELFFDRCVCLLIHKKNGDLGVKDLGFLNKALLANCSSYFVEEGEPLWM